MFPLLLLESFLLLLLHFLLRLLFQSFLFLLLLLFPQFGWRRLSRLFRARFPRRGSYWSRARCDISLRSCRRRLNSCRFFAHWLFDLPHRFRLHWPLDAIWARAQILMLLSNRLFVFAA